MPSPSRHAADPLARLKRHETTGGDPDCRLCFPWDGHILSLTGKTEGFPTYEEARRAGCFHPNCVHTLDPVDELLDADEIELQRAHPVDMAAAGPDELDENRYEIDQDRYRRKGMDAERARVAVDRDNLEASIRQGLLRDDAREVVDAMTDAQVTALCRDGNPPAFEPVKRVRGGTRGSPKYEDEKWNRGRRGGTVHVARDADAAKILEVCKTTDADLTLAKARAIEKAGASDGKTLRLSPISRETAEEIRKVSGVAPTSLTPTVGGNEIRHTFNRHGKHVDGLTKGETQKSQVPITADDIARIGTIINEYDSLSAGSFNKTENAPSVKFKKKMEDGTVNTAFVVADSLAFKTMWKKK